MSKTPRTDSFYREDFLREQGPDPTIHQSRSFAESLEEELNRANKRIKELEAQMDAVRKSDVFIRA